MAQYAKRCILLLVLLASGLTGCGIIGSQDSGSGKAPSFPNLDHAEADVSYFKNNNPKIAGEKTAETSNYYAAKAIVLGKAAYATLNKVYGTFFDKASSGDPKFKDGVWRWNHSIEYAGISAEVSTTAERLANNEVYWAMYWSYENGGKDIDHYRVMDGTIAEDGSEGEWRFNKLHPDTNDEIPVVVSNWNVINPTKKVMDLKIYDDGILYATVDYERDGPIYKMSYSYTSKPDVIVGWNDGTKRGYYIEDGNKECWDDKFRNIACS